LVASTPIEQNLRKARDGDNVQTTPRPGGNPWSRSLQRRTGWAPDEDVAGLRANAISARPRSRSTSCSGQAAVPGFESLPMTWFPKRMMEGFARLPGVTTRMIADNDADERHGVLLPQAGDPWIE
jgi:hypothetical protein